MSAPCPEYRAGGLAGHQEAVQAAEAPRAARDCRPPGNGPADAAQGGVAGALGARRALYQQANWMTGYDPNRTLS